MDLIEFERKWIERFSQIIPIKNLRHKIKNKFFSALEVSLSSAKNDILEQYAELITPTNDREKQKQILKQSVRLVEIEIASFCNRKCWFCPNSFVDRKSQSIELPEQLYLQIINNLAEIDYSGLLNFHRFNEPLANKDLILKRISQARNALPNAQLGIFTNGDYLDRDYLDDLRKAGITLIIMSYYFDKNSEFDAESIKSAMQSKAKKLSLNYKVIRNDIEQYELRLLYEGIYFVYQCWNPRIVGGNRAGSITDERITKKKRDFPCYYPLREIFIDYNGLVMPCCNMRSDVEAHKDFVLGDVSKSDLFALFMNENFIKIRKDLMSNVPKYAPCEYCYYKPNI
ncbi:SPASM domain-containing protein [Helicobacter sp. 23-1044]